MADWQRRLRGGKALLLEEREHAEAKWQARASALSLEKCKELQAIVDELVALKDLKDQELKLRSRRIVSIERNPAAIAFVDGLRRDYLFRKPIAWARARALSTLKNKCPS